MFNGKRLKAIEDRLDKLESQSFIEHPTESEFYMHFYGHEMKRRKRLQIRGVMLAVLNHLKIDIKTEDAKPEVLVAVNRRKS